MKKIIFAFLMTLMMSGCVYSGRNISTGELSGLQQDEITSSITIEGQTFIARVLDHDVVAKVKYESYSSLKNDLKRRSKNELWDKGDVFPIN